MPDQTSSRSALIRKLVLGLTVVLSLQIAASYAISVRERPLASPGLRMIPATFDNWSLSQEDALEPEVAAYLRPDDYILRDYRNQNGTSINLFVAYFKSLQTSYGPHSPRVCLPGSGWLTHSWNVTNISVPGKPEGIPVNKYVLEKNSQRILVTYWYQNDRRAWAEEFQVKLHLLPDLIKYRRSDVSLIRLITAISKDNSLDTPWKDSNEFARGIFPTLATRLAHTEQNP